MRLALSGGGEMADPIERVYRLAQQCVESVPVIVVGSGASMGHGLPGMWELAQYLVANVDPTGAIISLVDTLLNKKNVRNDSL